MRIENGQTIRIPSPIDVHVHLREPGGEDQETIYSGTRSAMYGGFQAVFDMPNNPRPHQTWTEEKLDQKIDITTRTSLLNMGFYLGVDLENPDFGQIHRMVPKAAGSKLYMGPTNGNTKVFDLDVARDTIDELMLVGREYGSPPIALHAREEIGKETASYIAWHDYPTHWCHLSTESEANFSRILTQFYPEFFTSGVTPHHLTMTQRNADYQQGWNGARMQPPLGNEDDAEAVRRAYNDGDIKILETDHAPHLPENKIVAETENPTGDTGDDCTTCYGISGNEFTLSVMVSLVMRGKITMDRLIDSTYDQPIRMMRLKKSKNPAQTVLEIKPFVIGESDRKSKSSNNPYIGWMGGAVVKNVIIDGEEMFNHGLHTRARILRTGVSL